MTSNEMLNWLMAVLGVVAVWWAIKKTRVTVLTMITKQASDWLDKQEVKIDSLQRQIVVLGSQVAALHRELDIYKAYIKYLLAGVATQDEQLMAAGLTSKFNPIALDKFEETYNI